MLMLLHSLFQLATQFKNKMSLQPILGPDSLRNDTKHTHKTNNEFTGSTVNFMLTWHRIKDTLK